MDNDALSFGWHGLTVAFSVSLVLLSTQYVFADSVATRDNTFNFGLTIKKFVFEIKETFQFDPVRKAEMKIVHANELDIEIQNLAERNENIPQEMIELQKRKLDEANQIVNENQDKENSVLDGVKSVLMEAFSKSELRQIQSDFATLRAEQDPEKKRVMALEMDDRVNKPTINLTCFGRIDSLEIAESENPYQSLQERCKILKLVPQTAASGIVD